MSDYSQANSPSQSVLVASNKVKKNPDQPKESRELAISIAQAASDRKADEIILLDVAEVSYLADYFVMVTGYSRVQVRAIAQASPPKAPPHKQLTIMALKKG